MIALVLLAAVGPVPAETMERFRAVEAAWRRNDEGLALVNRGQWAEAAVAFADALKQREKLYPGGHAELALSYRNLATLHHIRGEFDAAARLMTTALEMRERLYPKDRFPDGHEEVADALSALAEIYRLQEDYAKAEPLLKRALAMCERLYPEREHPDGHASLALSLNTYGILQFFRGDYAKAGPLFRRSLTMQQKLNPGDSGAVANVMNNLAVVYRADGDFARAETLLRRVVEMNERLYPKDRYPDGHRDLANGYNNLASIYEVQGEPLRALALYRRTHEMNEKLYPAGRFPAGHTALARTLGNMASLHQRRKAYDEAEPLYKRAVEMYERMYPKERFPDGSPPLASAIAKLATLHHSRAAMDVAEPLHRRALEMRRRLYPKERFPDGHPELINSVNNVAALLQDRGDYDDAEPLAREVLRMAERLHPAGRFPEGHPDIASACNSLGFLHHRRGETDKAVALLGRAARTYIAAAAALAATDETAALNLLAHQPLAFHAFLGAAIDAPAGDVYPTVWRVKAAIGRVIEGRHVAALASGEASVREAWEDLIALRRQRERLLLGPATGDAAKRRDAKLSALDSQIRALGDRLEESLPAVKRAEEMSRLGPDALRKALPANAALVDVVRYNRFTYDPKVKGSRGEIRTAYYAAFVITSAGIKRVELTEANDADEALKLWRRAIVEDSPAEGKYAAELHRRLWSPLRAHLPDGVATVYVCPDGPLNRLPWAALRDGRGRVLIEEHAVAVAPHAPFLLDRLTASGRAGRSSVLQMGGVAYDDRPAATTEVAARSAPGDGVTWVALPGAARELEQVKALAGERPVTRLDGRKAGAAELLEALPKAQVAHLATHGFFADATFRTAMQLDPTLFDASGQERVSHGSRSPLVLSGLVCAGANVPGTPGRGVVTAESIVGLDLRQMSLAVLSACETGLGDVAGGEGVYGLTRAFHVAGCRDVAASLWKVDDEATAALMTLFYRHLWHPTEPVGPAEAMRRAQLAVYRDPSMVKEWAAGRGPLPKPVPGSVAPPDAGKGRKSSPTKAWAAFVVSGPGN